MTARSQSQLLNGDLSLYYLISPFVNYLKVPEVLSKIDRFALLTGFTVKDTQGHMCLRVSFPVQTS